MNAELAIPIQKEIIKKMSAEQKLNLSLRLYYSARQLKQAQLRQQHPDWPEDQIQNAVKEIFLYART